MNYLSVPAMLGPAVGPLLGGFITTYLHWRLIFFINIPIGIAGIYLTNRYIANSREEHPGRLDWFGFFLSASGGTLLLLGLSLVGGELMPNSVAGAMCAGGAVMVVLYWLHSRRAERPLLDLRFFRVPTFQASVLGGSLFRIGLGAVPFLLPLALQEGLHMTAFKSGSITCASAFGGMFMRSLASRVLHRFGFRHTLMVNAALSGLAIAACGMFFPGTPTWVIWAVVLLGGFFPALQFTSLNSLAYAEIETRDVGRATSLASFIQQVSLGLGVTIARDHARYLAERARSRDDRLAGLLAGVCCRRRVLVSLDSGDGEVVAGGGVGDFAGDAGVKGCGARRSTAARHLYAIHVRTAPLPAQDPRRPKRSGPVPEASLHAERMRNRFRYRPDSSVLAPAFHFR